jgi:hypothetical protein
MAEENTWDGVAAIARQCGCRHDQLVAAQWALESGFGKHAPGQNYYGLKGSGQTHKTREFIGGRWVEISDGFLVFKDLTHATGYLVERWYKDWKGYQGVDRQPTLELAAKELIKQGYATDPSYVSKLLKLLADHGSTTKSSPTAGPAMLRFKANHATVLKKSTIDSRYLAPEGKRAVAIDEVIEAAGLEEIPADAHGWLTLADGERWAAYLPHFDRESPRKPVSTKGVDWGDFDAAVGEFITVGEVLQCDSRRRPSPGSVQEKNILAICRQFDAIRRAWGSGIGVTSGYRPEPINRQVGGVTGSMHVEGRALDIYPTNGDLAGFHSWLIRRWSGGYGDGRPRGFIHIDDRGSGAFHPNGGVKPWRVWTY